MESQPQNPEFRNNPENFQPCIKNDLMYLREKKDHTSSVISCFKTIMRFSPH